MLILGSQPSLRLGIKGTNQKQVKKQKIGLKGSTLRILNMNFPFINN
jgi:hypothetical protein